VTEPPNTIQLSDGVMLLRFVDDAPIFGLE
jgi:hypothetical protein